MGIIRKKQGTINGNQIPDVRGISVREGGRPKTAIVNVNGTVNYSEALDGSEGKIEVMVTATKQSREFFRNLFASANNSTYTVVAFNDEVDADIVRFTGGTILDVPVFPDDGSEVTIEIAANPLI